MKLYLYIVFTLGLMAPTLAMERDYGNEIKSKLETAQNLDEALQTLDDLCKDQNLSFYMQDHVDEIGSYLAKKFDADKAIIINVIKMYPQLYLLPKELQYLLEIYRKSAFFKELHDPLSRAHVKELIMQLKDYKNANPKLFKTYELKQAIKRFFEILAFEGDISSLNDLAKELNLEKEIIEWTELECELINAVMANNLEAVKRLVGEQNVNPEVPFVNYLPMKKSCEKCMRIKGIFLDTYAFAHGFNAIGSYLSDQKRMDSLPLKEFRANPESI